MPAQPSQDGQLKHALEALHKEAGKGETRWMRGSEAQREGWAKRRSRVGMARESEGRGIGKGKRSGKEEGREIWRGRGEGEIKLERDREGLEKS